MSECLKTFPIAFATSNYFWRFSEQKYWASPKQSHFFLFSDTLSEIKMSFVLLNLILFTFPSHLDCYHLFWKEIFKQQTPTKESKRNAVQFLISLSHLIFYSFGMTAENSPFDIFHDTFLCLEKKLTFYWVYLIIKSFSLESSNARWRSKSKNKHTTQLNIYSTQTSS